MAFDITSRAWLHVASITSERALGERRAIAPITTMELRDEREESEEDSEVDDLRQLELDRNYNDQKLKSRFEHIFRKYEHDFEGIGDEIEIASGDIVVDNGHLQHMRHEADPGKSASSRFVKTFQEKLGYEDESTSDEDEDDEDTEDDEGDEESNEDDASETPVYRARHAEKSSRSRRDHNISPRKAMNAFGDLDRPAPRLAHLLVGQGTPQPLAASATNRGNQDDSSIESTSGTSTPNNLLSKVPGLQESMLALQPRAKRSAVDPEAIEALGVSIANQLAQLMAGPSKSKHKKKSQARPRETAKSSMWDYPEIGSRPRKRRRRSPSPLKHPIPSSPAPGSPGEDSLWAPEGSVRPSKRLRRDFGDDQSQSTPAPRGNTRLHLPSSGNGTSKKDVRRCWNCSLTSTPSWQKGPHEQDLCESCARYYLRHRRMKPFDSPTPSIEDEENGEDDRPRAITHVGQEKNRHESRKASAVDEVGSVAEPIFVPSGEESEDENNGNENYTAEASDARMAVAPDAYSYRLVPSDVQPGQSHATSSSAELLPSPQMTPQQTFSYGHGHVHGPEHQRQQLDRPISYDQSIIYPAQPHYNHYRTGQPFQHQWQPGASNNTAPQSSHLRYGHHEETPGNEQHRAIEPFEPGYQANTSRTLTTSPKKRIGHFTIEEDALIIRLKEQEMLTWDAISRYFPDRSTYAISGRYTRELKFGRNPARDLLEYREQYPTDDDDEDDQEADPVLRKDLAWNDDQDELLLELREDQELEWDDIASLLPGHDPEAVERRYELLAERGLEQHIQKHNLQVPDLGEEDDTVDKRQGWFSPEEDAFIVRLREIERLEWSEIGEKIRTRPLQSIQRRYSRCLAPQRRKSYATSKYDSIQGTMQDRILAVDPTLAGAAATAPFEPEEDDLLKRLKDSEGLSWEVIADRLGGRPPDTVRHRYEYKFGREAAKKPPPPPRPLPPKTAAIPGTSVMRLDEKTEATPGQRDNERNAPPQPSQVSAAQQSPSHQVERGPGSRTPFTQAEDDIILQLREFAGLSWENIAQRLPGRSVKSISSRYTEVIRPVQNRPHSHAHLEPSSRHPNPSSPSPVGSAQQHTRPIPRMIIYKPPTSAGAAMQREESTAVADVSQMPSRSDSQRPKARSRTSLPSTLPSTSKSQNPLLRKALDNSLRRRSDIAPTSNIAPSSNEGAMQPRKKWHPNPEAPSQQLIREMELSLHTLSSKDTPAITMPPLSRNDESPESTDGGDRRALQKLMHAATKFAVQQKNPALCQRVKEIYDKNPDDERLHQLTRLASNSSIITTDVISALEQIGNPAQTSRDARPGSQRVSRKPEASQLPTAQTLPTRTVIHSAEQSSAGEKGVPQPLSPRRARRAAFDSASRKNAELLALPLELEHEQLNETEALVSTSPLGIKRYSDDNSKGLDYEMTGSGSSGSESSDTQSKRNARRKRPSSAKNLSIDFSPEELICNAFKSSDTRAMHVKDICASIETDNEMPSSWRSKIRAELTANPLFERVQTDDRKSGWQMTDRAGGSSGGSVAAHRNTQRVGLSTPQHSRQIQEDDAESTSVMDENEEAVIVNVGPKQRRICSSAAAARVSKHASKASGSSELRSALSKKSEERPNPKGRRVTFSPADAMEDELASPAPFRSFEIANSDEEEELHLGFSLEEPDELAEPTETPLVRKAADRLTSSDIYRDPISSDAADFSVRQLSTQDKLKASASSSSSPLFMKPYTPASSTFNRKMVTPKPSSSRLSQLKGQTPARYQSPTAIFMSRSSSVASSRRSSFGKRLVETPVREVDSDEDELA